MLDNPVIEIGQQFVVQFFYGVIGSEPSSGATGFKVSTAGLLQASNAVIYGTVYASSGTIGNWTIDGGNLKYGTKGNNGSIFLVPQGNLSATIGGKTWSDWQMTIGSQFGVDEEGNLVASGTVYAGNIVTSSTLSNQLIGTNIYLRKWDKMVFFQGSGVSFDAWDMFMHSNGASNTEWILPSGVRPQNNVYIPTVLRWAGSSYRLGCLLVRPSGKITLYAYATYGGSNINFNGTGSGDLDGVTVGSTYWNNWNEFFEGGDQSCLYFNASWTVA